MCLICTYDAFGKVILQDCQQWQFLSLQATGLNFRLSLCRGYVVNWDLERMIWDRSLAAIDVVSNGLGLLLTEPLFNPPTLQHQMDQACNDYLIN